MFSCKIMERQRVTQNEQQYLMAKPWTENIIHYITNKRRVSIGLIRKAAIIISAIQSFSSQKQEQISSKDFLYSHNPTSELGLQLLGKELSTHFLQNLRIEKYFDRFISMMIIKKESQRFRMYYPNQYEQSVNFRQSRIHQLCIFKKFDHISIIHIAISSRDAFSKGKVGDFNESFSISFAIYQLYTYQHNETEHEKGEFQIKAYDLIYYHPLKLTKYYKHTSVLFRFLLQQLQISVIFKLIATTNDA